MIDHGVNAQQNNLAEIQQTAQLAAMQVQQVALQERQVLSQASAQESGFKQTHSPLTKGLSSKIENSSSSLTGKSSNRSKVYGDVVTAKLGMPSLELGSMALDILSDRGSIFKSIKDDISGKKLGYNAGKKLNKTEGIKTAHGNALGFRAMATGSFNTSSCLKGVKATKGCAPDCKLVKDLVVSKKMVAEKTYGHAMHAQGQKMGMIGNAMRRGSSAKLIASLKSGPKFVDQEKAMRKAEDNNIWGDSETA